MEEWTNFSMVLRFHAARLGVPARIPADGMPRRDTVPMEPFSNIAGDDTRPDLLPAVLSDE